MDHDSVQVLLGILQKNINAKGLSRELLDLVIKPALDEVVKKTGTKLDDVALAAVYEGLSKEIVEYVDRLWREL